MEKCNRCEGFADIITHEHLSLGVDWVSAELCEGCSDEWHNIKMTHPTLVQYRRMEREIRCLDASAQCAPRTADNANRIRADMDRLLQEQDRLGYECLKVIREWLKPGDAEEKVKA